MLVDARIPVSLFGTDEIRADDALLAEGDHPRAAACFSPGPPAAHAAGCTCCAPRNAAGLALAALLLDRARGRTPFFRRVVALTLTQAGRAEVKAALDRDPIASSCFRLIDEAGH